MMKLSLSDELLRREIYDPYRALPSKAGHESANNVARRGLHSNKRWINDLDIVNQLGGHNGCVNALSWSTSGRLLASGSDDTDLNIYRYNPENTTEPFVLTTKITTGHTQNIFSVKFMPHSNDQTCVSAAGDHQVRVFDIEYSNSTNTNTSPPRASEGYTSSGFRDMIHGVQFLNPTTTNGRIYRSHADRVKRIVTESSPHLFLTCSEDGTVRQWDLRMPSSAYPSPRRGNNVPPPLINYRPYRLDLNSISCSGSQPHYIVLGGASLHAFLHDRRMLGRDTDSERGVLPSVSTSRSEAEEELMNKATKCVRRFAPNGKQIQEVGESGHITACKISDANPNEMVASYSSDHIYSFNLVSSPDVLEAELGRRDRARGSHRRVAASSNSRKRKRRQTVDQNADVPLPSGGSLTAGNDVALRVRYGNGQSEDIPLQSSSSSTQGSSAVELPSLRPSKRIAKSVGKIRRLLFSLDVADSTGSPGHSRHRSSFLEALDHAGDALEEMERVSSAWTYPILPDAETVATQNAMRRNRVASTRFVQTAGALSRILVKAAYPTEHLAEVARFRYTEREPSSRTRSIPTYGSTYQRFCHLFLAAIIAWLEGGRTALVNWFKPDDQHSGNFDMVDGDGEEAILDKIIPGLFALANEQERSIINVDASRFEVDSNRILFSKGADAVVAFSDAVSNLSNRGPEAPDLHQGSNTDSDSMFATDLMEQVDAVEMWAYKVGRGLLLSAGEGINYNFVNKAFGGSGSYAIPSEGRNQVEVDSEMEETVQSVRRMRYDHETGLLVPVEPVAGSSADAVLDDIREDEGDNNMESDDDFLDGDELDDDDDDDDDDDLDGLEDDDELEQSDPDSSQYNLLLGQAGSFANRRLAETDVPCASHMRVYRGHCNTKTVKDVNFFGPNDEYVVSGSDCGNLFIWDRKSGELMNILHGDSDIVNVIQGHPYEPMLAVSGIDHTIKIFSPDQRAQADARRGINLATSRHRSVGTSNLSRRRYRPLPVVSAEAAAEAEHLGIDPVTEPATPYWDDESVADEPPSNGGLESCRRMHKSYEIMSQNDREREGGDDETFLTRSMLLRYVASRMHASRRTGGDENGEEVGEDQTIVLDENCAIM